MCENDIFKFFASNWIIWLVRKKPCKANQFGWFKANSYQKHGVVCETSIIAQPAAQGCEINRKNWNLEE